jgi:hypothetical protein
MRQIHQTLIAGQIASLKQTSKVKNSGVAGVQELPNEMVAVRRKRKLQLLPSVLVKRQKLELSLTQPENSAA